MTEKVEIFGQTFMKGRFSSVVIAKTFERRHDQVTKLVDRYRGKFESFGDIEEVKTKNVGRPTVEYFLNESQFIYLITLFSNAGEVPENKRKLVKKYMEQSKVIEEQLKLEE